MRHRHKLLRAALLTGVAALGTIAFASEPTTPPDSAGLLRGGEDHFRRSQRDRRIQGAGQLIQEPDWVTEQFVKTGKLPPVKDRLPKEPLVFKTGNMPDGDRRLRRHDATCDRRPARGLELYRRPVAGLGRPRHRAVGMSDAHRAAVSGESRGSRAAAQSGQKLGLVRRRPHADHASDRRRKMVGRRAVHRGRSDVLLADAARHEHLAAQRRDIGDIRRRHDARRPRIRTRWSGPSRSRSRSNISSTWPMAHSVRARRIS